ncbi:MAG: ABC transporter permease [Acidobacteria bacterium]|nr:ABC transporter permease [Acidobacteriota bacterium]
MLIEANIERGMTPARARTAALRTFGGVTQMKEEYRDQRTLPWLEMFLQDARYSIRSLGRTPAFTVAALLTLTLGIGATAAIFSVINAVFLQPLPFHEPERIVQFGRTFHTTASVQYGHTGRRYLFFREHLKSVENLAAFHGVGYNLATSDGAEYVLGRAVSKEYFDVLAVRPLHGQLVTAEHDVDGGPEVTVISHGLWQRQFGGNPNAIGATVRLAEQPHTVIGVLPRDFVSLTSTPLDVYVPLRPGTTGPGSGSNYSVLGRLQPGVPLEQAAAEGNALFQAFKAEYPKQVFETERGVTFTGYQQYLSASVRPSLLVMLGAVAALLLIACANTASLLLARASGRGREIAVRAALGAGRSRILGQLLSESVTLSLAGAVLGVLLAYWSVPTLLAMMPPGFAINQDVRIDLTVLAVTFGVAVLTGVLFGLAPALSLSRHDLVDAFKEDATRTTSSRRSTWMRNTLVVAEVALCMLLLVGAGLLIQTFVKMRSIDPGFDLDGVVTGRMSLRGERYTSPAALNSFYEQGLERIRRIPGVQSAAVVNGVPIERGLNLNVTVLDGPQKVEDALTDWRYATANYFETMGIPITMGRAFDERDGPGAPKVAVVNQEFARQFFGSVNPLGHQIRVFEQDGSMEIIGVAHDVREAGLVGPLPALMYVPVAQTHQTALEITHSYFQVAWVVRTARPGPELANAMREEIRRLDPQQPFSVFRTMNEVKALQFQREQFQMTLFAILGGIGLVLATAGIYGLVSYSVAQRTREYGIRLALGATGGRILRSVLLQGALLATAGVVIGVLVARFATRTLHSLVFGVSTADPWTFVAVGVLLILAAAVASLVPGLRAIRLNPVTALRE